MAYHGPAAKQRLTLEAEIVPVRQVVDTPDKAEWVRFLLPALAPEVDWDGVDALLADHRRELREARDAEIERIDQELTALQERRQALAMQRV